MLLAQIQLVVTEQFTARRLWQMFQFLQLGAQFQAHAGHLITASAGGLVLHFVLVAALQELRMLLQRLQMLLASFAEFVGRFAIVVAVEVTPVVAPESTVTPITIPVVCSIVAADDPRQLSK